MKVSVTTIPLAELDVDLLLIPSSAGGMDALRSLFSTVDDPSVRHLLDDLAANPDDIVEAYPSSIRARRVALVGMGDGIGLDLEALRSAAARGAGIADRRRAETVGLAVPTVELDAEYVSQALVEGFLLGSYRFNRYRTTDTDRFEGPQRLVLHTEAQDKASRRGADRGRIIAEAVCSARDMVNMSPDEKTATLLSKLIEKSGKKCGYEVTVWDKALIEEEGMGGILAVNRGSVEPPTFSIMEWHPENAVNDRPIVLVGKGVVFDTGGLSLKPTKDSMDAMKSDMAGAAAVIATMEAISRLDVPVYVVAMVPATDNRPGENAYVPGDVVKMHSGLSVEVLNTDAEGRMLLADALSYARSYKPQLAIDVATLTGAAVVALGKDVAAAMTNETEGAAERIESFVAAGEASGDRVYPLPMFSVYAKSLESDVADLKNVGGREAGCITAGKFLERFVDYPWIHVDIAGPAFLKAADAYRPKGGTGFGVRLLVEYLRAMSSPKRRQQ